jgi:hypothetical protein
MERVKKFPSLNFALDRLFKIGSGTPGSIATHATACLNVKEIESLTGEIENLVRKHNALVWAKRESR